MALNDFNINRGLAVVFAEDIPETRLRDPVPRKNLRLHKLIFC
jgi:hypothetical protein